MTPRDRPNPEAARLAIERLLEPDQELIDAAIELLPSAYDLDMGTAEAFRGLIRGLAIRALRLHREGDN
jgi:hypothetical protein